MPPSQDRDGDRWRRLLQRWTEPADQWRSNVQHWVDAGIVTSSQGDQILAAQDPASVASHEHEGLSHGSELVWYLAVVLIGAGCVLFLGHSWRSIGLVGHLSVGTMIVVVGLGTGVVIAPLGGAGARRLSGFFWLIGTVGGAATVAAAAEEWGRHRHGLTMLLVGLFVLVVSVALWRNRERPLQFLSAVVGLVLTLCGMGTVGRLAVTSTEVSLIVWLIAVAVGLLSLQMLRPASTALIVAEFGSFGGAFALSFADRLGGLTLGLVTTLLAVAIGLVIERPLIIVVGAIGFFGFDVRVFSAYLRSESVAIGALVLGLVMACIALWYSRTFAPAPSGEGAGRRAQSERETEWLGPP